MCVYERKQTSLVVSIIAEDKMAEITKTYIMRKENHSYCTRPAFIKVPELFMILPFWPCPILLLLIYAEFTRRPEFKIVITPALSIVFELFKVPAFLISP